MAYSGQVLENVVSGERITFIETAAETGGERLVIDLELSPAGRVPGSHIHPFQEERFEIVSGVMKFRLGLKTFMAGAGQTVVIPAGKVHRFANGWEEPARSLVVVRPALRMEALLETAAALATEGRTNRRGMPRPLDLASFMAEFDEEVRAPFVPPGLVRALMAPLLSVARQRGLDTRYDEGLRQTS
jgi:quercetin dioxygenase-like cupin family protein